MKTNPRPAALLATLMLACGAIPAAEPARSPAPGPAVRIVEPGSSEILYGRTRILAAVSTPTTPAYVTFRLDRYPHPICLAREAPYTCEFDAGKELRGHRIEVAAFGSDGARIGAALLDTLDFSAPVEVRESTLVVPVVALSKGGEPSPSLTRESLECEFGGKPCSVEDVHRLGEADRDPVSLDILVDVSRSMEMGRAELVQALEYVLDHAPGNIQIAVTEFAGNYRIVCPYTRDRGRLKDAIDHLSYAQPYTCLLGAMRKSLERLQARRGHRILFVITDGEETCEIENEEPGSVGVSIGAIHHTVTVSRRVGAPVYIYHLSTSADFRIGGLGYATMHEGIADETGGKVFARGEITGLPKALEEVVDDLKSMWLVDLGLPEPGDREVHRLRLTGAPGVDLRHPEYLMPGSRLEALLAMLEDGDFEVRAWGAARLASRTDRRVLVALRRALRKEKHPDAIVTELSAIYCNVASLLVHGRERDQDAALDAVEELESWNPLLVARLLPALRVYLKKETPSKLRTRAERSVAAAGSIPEDSDPRVLFGDQRS